MFILHRSCGQLGRSTCGTVSEHLFETKSRVGVSGGKDVGEGDTTGWERLGVYIRTPLNRSSTPLSTT